MSERSPLTARSSGAKVSIRRRSPGGSGRIDPRECNIRGAKSVWEVRGNMNERHNSNLDERSGQRPMNYSAIFRVIGQALEPLRPETYEVVCYADCYLVRCRVKEDRQAKKEEEKKVRGLAAFLRLWREPKDPSLGDKPVEGAFMNVEFLYSVEELKRQDEERKGPRRDPHAMPEPYSHSNTLRAVGEFLDRKLEEYPISTLYDFSVKRYVKRKK